MNEISDERDWSEAEMLDGDVSDDALEQAAGSGKRDAANPTVPSAIICIPFEA